jgi:6-phosphogluconolactonase
MTASEPELVVLPTADAAAGAAAERIATILAEAAGAHGRADWATTGGSAMPSIYAHLAALPLRDVVPWPSVHVWWGDDRYVPHDHPLSNVKPLDDILLAIGAGEEGLLGMADPPAAPVPLPFENLHPFPTSTAIGHARGPGWCADELAGELRGAGLAQSGDWPVFDLIVLGVGTDGHVLSVFPGSAALDATELAMAIPAPTHIEPHVPRVTLNPALLGVARRILTVATGAAKAAVLAEVLETDRDPRRWPAQLARRPEATWILDSAAASRLHRGA